MAEVREQHVQQHLRQSGCELGRRRPGPGVSHGPGLPTEATDAEAPGDPGGSRPRRLLLPQGLTAGFVGAERGATALSDGVPSPWGSLSPLLRTRECVPLAFLGPFKTK